jgi:hypothetical protein
LGRAVCLRSADTKAVEDIDQIVLSVGDKPLEMSGG